jgi:hypothetical protein
MKIGPVQDQVTAAPEPSSQGSQVKNLRGTSPALGTAGQTTAAESSVASASSTPALPTARPTDVSLRRDNNGKMYYVISDANSGQEILQVPPKAIRDVSQGIEDYLKETQSKAASHVEVKA